MTFPTDADRCKDEFVKTGMWPNEVMYQLWRKAWAAGHAARGVLDHAPCASTYAGCAPECGPHNRCRPLGCALAMRVMQSDLYRALDDAERADCDELTRRNLEWFRQDASGVDSPEGKSK